MVDDAKPTLAIAPGTLVTVPMSPVTGPPSTTDVAPAGAPRIPVKEATGVPPSVVAVHTVEWWRDKTFVLSVLSVLVSVSIEIDRIATAGTLSWHSAIPIVLGSVAAWYRASENTVVR